LQIGFEIGFFHARAFVLPRHSSADPQQRASPFRFVTNT
jgi:hypothetical protein